MENLDALLRFRRLDRNNCDEEAMVKLMTVAADRIAELEAALRNIADPLAFHTIQEMREIAKTVL